MEPRMVSRGAFNVMGVLVHSVPEKVDFNAVWSQQYMPRDAEVKPLSTDNAYYGLWRSSADPNVPDYIAGMAVGDGAEAPAGLVIHRQPATQYAVFECAMKTMGATYGFIYGQWFPASPYEFNPGCGDFEFYPPGATDESPAFIYIPVRYRLVAVLDGAQTQVQALLDRAQPDTVAHPASGWTVKDVLAHVNAWNHEAVASLRAYQAGGTYSIANLELETYNQQHYRECRELPYERVHDAWLATHRDLAAAVGALTPEQVCGKLTCPWNATSGVAEFVRDMMQHEREHGDEIAETLVKD
jgi:AraC family transcriptional regulator